MDDEKIKIEFNIIFCKKKEIIELFLSTTVRKYFNFFFILIN
jgi:hypothetical protein